MNINATVRNIIEAARNQATQNSLPKHWNKAILRLQRTGFIDRVRRYEPRRGRPTFILMLLKELPCRPVPPRLGRKRPRHDAVLNCLGSDELSLAEICSRLGFQQCNLSSTLLEMCKKGVLLRRRKLGRLDKNAVVSDHFLYRVAPVVVSGE